MSDDGTFRFQGRQWVLDDPKLKLDILKEAYASKLAIHLDSTKMYRDLILRF